MTILYLKATENRIFAYKDCSHICQILKDCGSLYNIVTAQTGTGAAEWNSLIGLLSQGDTVPDNEHKSLNLCSTIALSINRVFLRIGRTLGVEVDNIFQVDSLFASKCCSG